MNTSPNYIEVAIGGGWTESKAKILNTLKEMQCYELDENHCYLNDDETPLPTYKRFEEDTGISKAQLKIEVIAMRNAGLIELVNAVNSDYMISGSGWLLTQKGIDLINHLAEGKDAPSYFKSLLTK